MIGAAPDAVRDARFKYRRATGQELRSRPHLSDVSRDEEAHNLASLHPASATRLREALDAMTDDVRRNPRGWRSAGSPHGSGLRPKPPAERSASR